MACLLDRIVQIGQPINVLGATVDERPRPREHRHRPLPCSVRSWGTPQLRRGAALTEASLTDASGCPCRHILCNCRCTAAVCCGARWIHRFFRLNKSCGDFKCRSMTRHDTVVAAALPGGRKFSRITRLEHPGRWSFAGNPVFPFANHRRIENDAGPHVKERFRYNRRPAGNRRA